MQRALYIRILTIDKVFPLAVKIMKEDEIKRAAMLLNLKYGKSALIKAIDTARFYVESNDNEAAKRWISIGYKVKEIQGLVADDEIDNKTA